MDKNEILNIINQVDNAVFDALDYSMEEHERERYLKQARTMLRVLSNTINSIKTISYE